MTKDLSDHWHNVFHMTTGDNGVQYGDYIPALWVNKAKFFRVHSSISGNVHYLKDFNYNFNLNQWYHIEIKQEEKSNGEIIFSITMDATIILEVVNTLPQQFREVILYESDPWYPSFASFGELKDLTIVNLDKYVA